MTEDDSPASGDTQAIMRRSCIVLLIVLLALVIGAAGIVMHFLNKFNPSYEGKRVHAWAEQAVWSKDSTTRREAARVLVQALQDMKGEPRTQLVMQFCYPHRSGEAMDTLPPEVIPVLIEALRAEDRPDLRYAMIALVHVAGPDTVPALMQAFTEGNPRLREGVVNALGGFGREAKAFTPVVRQALEDDDKSVREAAAEALKRIDAEAVEAGVH
jgi:hypothetical protein